MVITDVNQITYNGDGVTTAWPFTFPIIDYTDLRLTLINAAGARTDITSDYYVDMVNNTVYYPGYAPGAEPPEANQPPKVQTGEKLEIYRRVPVNQLADLGEKWPFNVIEKGLDKLTMICQDIYSWIGRNIVGLTEDGTAWDARNLPISNVGGPVNVEDAATKDYVDRILSGIIASGDGRVVPFDNVAQLIDADVVAGQIAATLGYYDVNDGGAGVYNIRAKTPYDVDDGGSIIFLDNGNLAELINDGTVNVKQFGAVGDGVEDDTDAFTNAVNYGKRIVINNGSYLVVGEISVPDNKEVCGVGEPVVIIHATADSEKGIILGNNTILQGIVIDGEYNSTKDGDVNFANTNDVYAGEKNNVKIRNVKCTGGGYAMYLYKCNNSIIEECVVDNVSDMCIIIEGCTYCKILRNKVSNAARDGIKTSGLSESIIIDGNESFSNGRDGYDLYDGFLRSIFTNNIGHDNAEYGIDAKGTPDDDNRFVIRDSVFSDCLFYNNKYGVDVRNLENCLFVNIIARRNALTGFRINKVYAVNFTNCLATRNTGDGYLFVGTARNVFFYNCTAINNSYTDGTPHAGTYSGMVVDNGAKVYVNGGYWGNWGATEAGGQAYGIYCASGSTVQMLSGAAFENNYTRYINNDGGTINETFSKVSIETSTDLDTLTDVYSQYYCYDYTTVATLINCPTSENFVMVVFKYDSNKTMQQITDSSGNIYSRHQDSLGAWLGWRKCAPLKYSSSAPSTGDHQRGEMVYDETPSAGGYVGWVCVAAGTPGTWKGFGQIES